MSATSAPAFSEIVGDWLICSIKILPLSIPPSWSLQPSSYQPGSDASKTSLPKLCYIWHVESSINPLQSICWFSSAADYDCCSSRGSFDFSDTPELLFATFLENTDHIIGDSATFQSCFQGLSSSGYLSRTVLLGCQSSLLFHFLRSFWELPVFLLQGMFNPS